MPAVCIRCMVVGLCYQGRIAAYRTCNSQSVGTPTNLQPGSRLRGTSEVCSGSAFQLQARPADQELDTLPFGSVLRHWAANDSSRLGKFELVGFWSSKTQSTAA
jgi:hypothetical protein